MKYIIQQASKGRMKLESTFKNNMTVILYPRLDLTSSISYTNLKAFISIQRTYSSQLCAQIEAIFRRSFTQMNNLYCKKPCFQGHLDRFVFILQCLVYWEVHRERGWLVSAAVSCSQQDMCNFGPAQRPVTIWQSVRYSCIQLKYFFSHTCPAM